MRDGAELQERVFETLAGYMALGHEVRDYGRIRIVTNREVPQVWDANFACRLRGETPEDLDAIVEILGREFAGYEHRQVIWDPGTPPEVEARLVLEGYTPEADIELLLEGELRGKAPPVELRELRSEADWKVFARLMRLDHEEEARKFGKPVLSEEVTAQIVRSKRAKCPGLRFWLASDGEVGCGFFSSWPGTNGVGKVEDLFTHPDYRRRGVATALIHRAVDDARARGAGPVVIGAASSDTPKWMYARLGFRPFALSRYYRRSTGGSSRAPSTGSP